MFRDITLNINKETMTISRKVIKKKRFSAKIKIKEDNIMLEK